MNRAKSEYIEKEKTMAGTSKRIRVANRSEADLFLAKDFLELGGTQNAVSYKNPDYLNMSGSGIDRGPGSVARVSFSDTTTPPSGIVNILVCTNPWDTNNVTEAGQIKSYIQPGPAGGQLIDDSKSTFYNAQVGAFVVQTTDGQGDSVNCSQLTWWWSSMIVLDRFGVISNSNYTTQYGFYTALVNDVDQNVNNCQWSPGNLDDFNLNSVGTTLSLNALPGSCAGNN